MQIFIPTHGRADSQPTYELFKNIADVTVVAGSKDSLPDLPGAVHRPDRHVGQARQNCLDIARERGYAKIMMLDDDMKFFVRKENRFTPASERDLAKLLKQITKLLDKYAHGGVTQRFMANHTTPPYETNRRYLRTASFNLEMIEEPFPKYRLSVHEDIDMQLQLAARGLASFLVTSFAVDDHGQYAPGGCSRSRTPEVERAEFEKLHKFHPKYTSFTPNPRTGVYRTRVAWAKAYQEGRK